MLIRFQASPKRVQKNRYLDFRERVGKSTGKYLKPVFPHFHGKSEISHGLLFLGKKGQNMSFGVPYLEP